MAAQKCLREKCTRRVDTSKRGTLYCHQHIGDVADSVGAAKSEQLSGIRPIRIQRETIEHNDPEFGGVEAPVEPEEEAIEGIVIETPEQREAAEKAEEAERKYIENLAAEMGALDGLVKLYEKSKKRQDEIKAELRDKLPANTYTIAGVEFEVNSKEVFDAKLATAAAATEDEDGNKVKPLLTKAQLDKISVSTPNAAKANAEFKNDPTLLSKLKKEQKSLSIKSVAKV